VTGLNSTNIEWNNSRVKRYIETMLSVYQGIHEGKDAPTAYYIPFQITLHVLQALYFQFETEMEEEVNEQEIIAGLLAGKLTSKNPESRAAALNTSLRAIAYFSWEPESRLFLVRRVFPTYFDFLSVSHIPEGWGVSSVMLKRLQGEFGKSGFRNGSISCPVDVDHSDNLAYTLPYLAEQERLMYKHVLLLPVFRKDQPESDRDMLGTFLFFINARDGVPSGEAKFKFTSFAQYLCPAFAELISAHDKALIRGSSLAREWQKVREGRQHEAHIAKVVLRCDHSHEGARCPDLENAAREFLKALTIPNYYAIRDLEEEEKGQREAAVFLVAARPGADGKLDELFRKRLLRIVTEQLSEKKVICRVDIKTGDPAGDEIFCLRADHKWH
jgi:hypothetical protein